MYIATRRERLEAREAGFLVFTILKTFGKISTPEEEVIHKKLNMEWRLSNSCSYKKKEEKEERKKAWVRK